MNKIYKEREWLKFKTFNLATKTHGKMKIDDDGNIIEWIHGGKRVECKFIRKVKCSHSTHLDEKLDGQIYCSECQENLNNFV